MRTIYRSEPPWPHRILILGGGFAGVETARHLEKLTRRRDDVEVWLVRRENFTLFTPLLPEVCSGQLEARHCVTALRAQMRWAAMASRIGSTTTAWSLRSAARPRPSASAASNSTRSA